MASLTPDDVPGFDVTSPLDTDRDVLRGVDRLLDQDSRRQRSLWLMFLSDDSVLLPAVVPIEPAHRRRRGLTSWDHHERAATNGQRAA
jgi:hypothetical protein